MRQRYEPILAPDESWMVFDIVAGRPAEFDGHSLIGLAADECGELARSLNREDRARASEAELQEARSWTN